MVSTVRLPTVVSLRHARFLREVASLPSLVIVALCLLVAVPATIVLTPDQHTTVAGQDLAVGARVPSLSWAGPAQLVQIGNTELDLDPLRIVGPLRPQITLGPVQRNAAAAAVIEPGTGTDAVSTAQRQIIDAFTHWYAWAALILFTITIGLVALAACVRLLLALRRESREHPSREPLTVVQLWHHSRTQVRAMVAVAVTTSAVAWAVCGALAYTGVVDGLSRVRSLTDLVGTYYVAPAAAGPTIAGFEGAVIGDSRAARLGGPPVADATAEDLACARSSDSLAAEIGGLAGMPVANLACSGATITAGLRAPQAIGDMVVPPQVARLYQMAGLKFVVVVIGPNDLGWREQLFYCYGVQDCGDRLTEGEFTYRLAAFDQAYGDLLRDLNDLPGAPQVIVMTSYDAFTADAACVDVQGPEGSPGLTPPEIELLGDRTRQFNEVLLAGADKYDFAVAQPALTPLCGPVGSLGADIQGLGDSAPFHPTAVGVLRLASSVVRVLDPAD